MSIITISIICAIVIMLLIICLHLLINKNSYEMVITRDKDGNCSDLCHFRNGESCVLFKEKLSSVANHDNIYHPCHDCRHVVGE